MKETFYTNWVLYLWDRMLTLLRRTWRRFANSKNDGTEPLDRKVVCLSAGTAAVHLALIGCGVKAGDEVLIFNSAGACLLCFLGYLRFARWFLRFARDLTLMAAKAINGLEFFVHAMP